MKSKLERVYLKYRFPVLILAVILTAALAGVNQWREYQYKNAKSLSWKVKEVITGDAFIVKNNLDGKTTKVITLCGIIPAQLESKQFLQSVIDRGDGSIELEQVGKNVYEAWVMLKPDFERQIHLNTYMVEKGMARHDTINSKQCQSHEELGFAQNIAQEEKLGLWSRSTKSHK